MGNTNISMSRVIAKDSIALSKKSNQSKNPSISLNGPKKGSQSRNSSLSRTKKSSVSRKPSPSEAKKNTQPEIITPSEPQIDLSVHQSIKESQQALSNGKESKRQLVLSNINNSLVIAQSRTSQNQPNGSKMTSSQSKVAKSMVPMNEPGLFLTSTNVIDNKLEGTGKLNSEDYVYYGQWSESKFNGYGRITKRNFALYEGQFVNNRRDGYGVEIYVNSDIFIGQFKRDKKEGLGIYLFSTGGYYYGFFDKNFRDGFGTLYNRANRQTYTGYWKKDQRHGRGIEFYKNGSKYDGFFENDKRHGVGFMEYSKSLLYIGEWNRGKRDGLGKVEHNKKTVSGRFKSDHFVEPFYFNSSCHADILLNSTLPKTVEEYLKEFNYKLKKSFIRGIGDIYAVLKESLVSYVMSLVESNILRLNCYLKLKNIFSKSSRFEYVMDDILLTLKYEPNPNSLNVFWDPVLREILINKHDFSWQRWEIDVRQNKIIFDESQTDNGMTDIQFKKTEKTIQMIITNELVIAKTTALDGEGVVHNQGFGLRYFKSQSSEWENTATVRIFPFFLLHEDFSSKSIFSLKLTHYHGEFYFGKDNFYPRNLNMFLAMDQENIWYSVGIDSVGAYVMAGRCNQGTATGQLLQKYFSEYQIEYEIFLATNEKIQGLWKTTNMGGHFVLRKDPTFRFSSEIARVLHSAFEQEKLTGKVELDELDVLKPYMESSILSVIVKGAQGGLADHCDKKEEIGDMELFAKYKKLHELDMVVPPDFIKKLTTEINPVRKTSSVNHNKFIDTYSKSTGNITEIEDPEDFSKKARASLAFLNLKAFDKAATQELEEIKDSPVAFNKNDFQRKLSNAVRGLKQVISDSIKNSLYRFDHNSENISWVGNFVTLGKKEQLVFDNLYIIGDTIEGIFTDSDEISYELAGSYSVRTKEFEIVGMSFDKTKSIKIKGELQDFKLKGHMSKKPNTGPSSNVEIKLLGFEGKSTLRLLGENVLYENLPMVLKLTNSYLYGIVLFEKDYVFLNGVRDRNEGYCLEINTNNKKIKNVVLMQMRNGSDDQSRTSNFERKLTFINEEIEVILCY